MTSPVYRSLPDRTLYFDYSGIYLPESSDSAAAVPSTDPGARYSKFALYEDGELTEYQKYEDNGPEQGDIYLGRCGDCIKSSGSVFVVLKNASGGTIRGYLRSTKYRPGDKLLVQVVNQAEGNKYCRLSDKPSFSGRYSVIILCGGPGSVRVSSKITDEAERERLKSIGTDLIRGETDLGLILRTNARAASAAEIIADYTELSERIKRICSYFKNASDGISPELIYRMPFYERKLLEYPESSISKVFVNSPVIADLMRKRFKDPHFSIELYQNSSIFENKIDRDMASISGKTVHLKSGGNIVIERTEALTVIDVNSAKDIFGDSKRELVYRINCEAAAEIARQLRLRSIKGIVICDMINMDDTADEQRLTAFMDQLIKNDPAGVQILGFTRSKLLEIVRSRAVFA